MNTSRKTIAFLVLLAVCFLLLAMYSFFQYRTATALEARNRQLQQELQKADALADDSAAVNSYKKLPARPEIPFGSPGKLRGKALPGNKSSAFEP